MLCEAAAGAGAQVGPFAAARAQPVPLTPQRVTNTTQGQHTLLWRMEHTEVTPCCLFYLCVVAILAGALQLAVSFVWNIEMKQ